MDENLIAAQRGPARRARRVGFVYIALSPIVGIVFGLLFTVMAGLVFALLCLAVGVYIAFAYAPFAAWIRRWEQARGR